MPSFLFIKNPMIVGGKNSTKFSIQDGSLNRFIAAFRSISKHVPSVPSSGVAYMCDSRFLQEAQRSRSNSLSMEDIVDLVDRQIGLDAGDIFNGTADKRSKMILLQHAFIHSGYDGVIYNDVQKRFGLKMDGITKKTRHYVAFKPDQISCAIGHEIYIQSMRKANAHLSNFSDEDDASNQIERQRN